jgi:hypothetical protein
VVQSVDQENVMTAAWSGLSDGSALRALLAAVARSPILWRPAPAVVTATGWAAVRKSGNADAFVLAWIASHVRAAHPAPRVLN